VKFLLDTNIVSETRRRSPDPNVLTWLRRADPADLYISVLTIGEVVKGCEAVGRRDPAAGQALRHWLDGLRHLYAERLIGIDMAVAEEWGRLMALRPLPVIDGLLAATVSVHDMTLVTRNVKDVEGTGIALVNPWD
jgi:predicted nucleic acid-binding protein